MNHQERIIVALDVDRYHEARDLVDTLEDAVFFKVGIQDFLKFG